jgi:adenylate cyclase
MAGSADRAGAGPHTNHPSDAAAEGAELLARARILVVDDLDVNVILLQRLLRAAGVGTVETLTDPRLVAEHCVRRPPDLVLLDMYMPEMGGVEVLEALHAALPPDLFVPVVVVTGDTTSLARERALAAGAQDFLSKPIDRNEVVLLIQRLLETRSRDVHQTGLPRVAS